MKRFSRISAVALLALAPLALWSPGTLAADKAVSGKEIYQKQCAQCHGGNGEGVAEEHDEPLYGDRSLTDLTKLIDETMPKDAPEEVSAEEAAKVAAYLYETFYTSEARARNRPPRIELSRLTVRQYQQVAADLLATFGTEAKIGEPGGLDGGYYNSRNFARDKQILDRVDPKIEFDFGEASPEAEKIGASEFSIRWQGSLIAPETGDYEFCVKTQNGVRLWVNNPEDALIDGWVSSGGELRELTATIRLLGGRAYPIKVDFFKYKDKAASVSLRWKPPHRAWEAIPKRNLSTRRVPQTFVVTSSFPPDDSSAGYPRGAAVSKAWDKATTDAAIEIANYVLANLDQLAKTKRDAGDRKEQVKHFCRRFAERAFRRPLSDEQMQFFIDSRFDEAADIDSAVKRVVLLVLKSPRFLYPELDRSPVDDYDVATRLSLALWDSLPDDQLIEAAAKGELNTAEQVTGHAHRMLADPRARSKVREFFHHWLPFDEAEDLSKDAETFPGFDESLAADLRMSLELFIDDVVWGERSDYRQLLLADYWFVNGPLAKFYGVQSPDDGEFHKIAADPKQRAGIVTHPYLLSALAYHKSSSPIHRGVFATRKLLGRALKPPPAAIQFMDGSFDPHMTMREKVAELTKSQACQACHSFINPLGFSLEHYDAVGRFRTEEKQKPIDAAGEYTTLSGSVVRLTGARDLAEHAAASEDAHRGFIGQLFEHVAKQPAAAYGRETLENLTRSFGKSEYNVQSLLIEITKVAALDGVAARQGDSHASN